MTTSFATFGHIALLVAAIGCGTPALAQGTPEQREACTPDALRLCADTIPDADRTAQCMRTHRPELSPRCQAVFDVKRPADRRRTHVAGEKPPRSPSKAAAGTRVVLGRTKPKLVPLTGRRLAFASHAHGGHGSRETREARRVIGRMCGTGLVDAGTCGFMGRVLSLAE